MLLKTESSLVNLAIFVFLLICLLATVYTQNFNKTTNIKNWKIYKEKYADRKLEISSGMVRSHAIKPISITKKGKVEFNKVDGKTFKVVWKRNLNESISISDSSRWAIGNNEVYITKYKGLIALDKKSGKTLWQSDGPTWRLLAIENLIIACDGDSRDKDKARFVVARKAINGEIAWKTEISQDGTPTKIIFNSGYNWVIGTKDMVEGYTYLITPKGKILKKYKEYVTDIFNKGNDIIFVSNIRIAKIDKDTNLIWEVSHGTKTPFPFNNARIMDAKNDNLLMYFYSPLSPSSVSVWKINSQKGELKWKTVCPSIAYGPNSKYRHNVYLKIVKEEIAVVSKGGWYFLEILSLKTGVKKNRYEF
ncbi:MAG: hypothetical protein COA79_22960 [Planctomycetota bacterium]|nr:MAG: hypothetical protein COA79_22960 [Planctomycetota bacterium]